MLSPLSQQKTAEFCDLLSFFGNPKIREKRGPRGILCTSGEKEYASIRQPTAACDNRLVKREAYDASLGRVTLLPYVFKIAQENHIFLKSLYLTNIVC